MNDRISRLINQIKAHLMKMYGEGVKKVILYGSYVRDEATKDSDIDILVLVDNSGVSHMTRWGTDNRPSKSSII